MKRQKESMATDGSDSDDRVLGFRFPSLFLSLCLKTLEHNRLDA